ncbi:acetyl-coenzyme A synthetase 2-like, mitochondrial [Sycon ciliatum]|uniref:acetyl-coenzyme A synthetase 2-like, mitochondrial n=1 Tax=Sycon ciliatum TaxID=27933 RepID=UPI0031F64EC9
MMFSRSSSRFFQCARANSSRNPLQRQQCNTHIGQWRDRVSVSDLKPAPRLASVSSNWKELHAESLRDPEQFFGSLALERLKWQEKFQVVRNVDMNKGHLEWFLGGKLNVSENCVDRHANSHPDRPALVWEKDEPGDTEIVTYQQLLEMVCKIANVLKEFNVHRGDVVAIYMPVSPMAVATMLACARIGAVHSVIFAGFGADSIRSRITDAGAKVVVTADQGVRAGKTINLKQTVDRAVDGLSLIETVLVMQRTKADVPMKHGRDVFLDEAMLNALPWCMPEVMNSEDPLFILYTSGSTGPPKGLLHTQAGYLLYAGLTHQYVFDCSPGDMYACVADIGWITGHSYVVYGPLSNGVSTVLYEPGVPTYPDPGRYWEMVERLRIKQFYTAPTAIRMLMTSSDTYVTKYNRSTLRTLGSVGEPINAKAWQWYHDLPGEQRCAVVDTWWQTETGGISLTPRPAGDTFLKPGMPMRSFFGVEPVLVDPESGQPLEGNNVNGHLCLSQVPPGMARTIYGSHQKYQDTYWNVHPGLYFSGDEARRDSDGHYEMMGRVDDVMNPKGHRLESAEVEDALVNVPAVVEAGVVGYPHPQFGEGIYAFVVVKEQTSESDESVIQDMRQVVRQRVGGFAAPDRTLIVKALPKVRSGKIMRRVLRKIAADISGEVGDTSTCADSSVIDPIIELHEKKFPKSK